MLYSLVQFTTKYVNFSTTELILLARLFRPIILNKNETVIKDHLPLTDIYFLEKGILKSFSKNDTSLYKQKIYFYPIFFSDLNAILHQKESMVNYFAIKKSYIFKANFEDIIDLSESSKKHNLFFKKIFEDDYMFNKYNYYTKIKTND